MLEEGEIEDLLPPSFTCNTIKTCTTQVGLDSEAISFLLSKQ